MRRVVTGHDRGRSTVVAVDELPEAPLGTGATMCQVWASDVPDRFPNDGSAPRPPTFAFPPIGGYRMQIVRLKAGGTEAFHAFIADGLMPVADPNRPGMHRSASTDFGLVLSGELVLELDDGTEVRLAPGDVVVQNGTRHRWVNRGDTDAVWAAFVVGAEQAEAPTFLGHPAAKTR